MNKFGSLSNDEVKKLLTMIPDEGSDEMLRRFEQRIQNQIPVMEQGFEKRGWKTSVQLIELQDVTSRALMIEGPNHLIRLKAKDSDEDMLLIVPQAMVRHISNETEIDLTRMGKFASDVALRFQYDNPFEVVSIDEVTTQEVEWQLLSEELLWVEAKVDISVESTYYTVRMLWPTAFVQKLVGQHEGGESQMTEQQPLKKSAMKQPNIQPAQFEQLKETTLSSDHQTNLSMLLDIPLQVTVELGRSRKTVKDILEITQGSIIELDKMAGDPVDILVNQKLIAVGEVVVVDEQFGIRVTEISSQADRLAKLR
ncbi:flagellar motor switch protein FliN [Chryseomicrobium palamuruense]|uniref:Flagellar motor switch protein FliN n=1 Tax=Chryseomicrobium palamuruense TaxID=682973 RepID=A0ABV8UWR4_9BACL